MCRSHIHNASRIFSIAIDEWVCKVYKTHKNVWPVLSKGYITDNGWNHSTNNECFSLLLHFHYISYRWMCHSSISYQNFVLKTACQNCVVNGIFQPMPTTHASIERIEWKKNLEKNRNNHNSTGKQSVYDFQKP